jgi:hypothetical protein
MKDTMSKRQESLKEYGIQIKLTLAVSKDKETGVYKVDESKLRKLIKEHKEYFKDIIDGKKAIKLREEDKGAIEVLFSKIKTVIKSLFPSIKALSDKDSLLADRESIVTEAIKKLEQEDTRKAVTKPKQKDTRKAVGKPGKGDLLLIELREVQRKTGKYINTDGGVAQKATAAISRVQLKNPRSSRLP